MKYVYHIFTILFLLVISPQSWAASAAADYERVHAQFLNIVRVSEISREEYIMYLRGPEVLNQISEKAGFEVLPVKIQGELAILNHFLEHQNKRGEEFRADAVALAKDFPKNLYLLLNGIANTIYTMAVNMNVVEQNLPILSKFYVDGIRVLREELCLVQGAFNILKPLASEDYNKDFREYSPTFVGSPEGALREPKCARLENRVRITTSSGVQFEIPLFSVLFAHLSPKANFTYEKPLYEPRISVGKSIPTLRISFLSNFEIRINDISEEEATLLMNAYMKEARKYQAEEMEAEERARREEVLKEKKAKRDAREAKAGGGAGASLPETKSAPLDIDTILAALGEPPPPESRKARKGKAKAGGGAAAAASTSVTTVTMEAPVVVETYGGAGSPPSVEAAARGGAGAASSEPMHPKGGAGEAAATALIAASVSAERALLNAIILRRVEEMAREKSAPMPERPLPSGAGSVKKTKDILSILLGEPLAGETVVRPINTIVWDELIYMLKGLGFRNIERDVFMDGDNHRLHLDALHYDGYAVNYKLLGILFKQLAYYGFTTERLKELLTER